MAVTRKTNPSKGRMDLIGVINTPLGFYVLALLIVESTLAIVLSCSKHSEDHVLEGFKWMIGVLGAILLIVTSLTIFNPRNLLYGKAEHFSPALDPSALKDQIEDLIHANVKPECLQKDEKGGK
jgi:hypothetical protein